MVKHGTPWVPLVLVGYMSSYGALAAEGTFVAFESDEVRPMAMSADGKRIYVVNTPDNRLEIFRIGDAGLTPIASVPVGMEPVAVGARSDNEVWVVNHLSDSASIVRTGPNGTGVVRTLLVGTSRGTSCSVAWTRAAPSSRPRIAT
jgi:DNA-binding beta-propeller fold protein YncE